ncbi:MAG: hypothetical protein KDA90_00360 [Planctomycetaceae bacterium]|nr:hypothetical protein [Planctomycetaceae bacterium]
MLNRPRYAVLESLSIALPMLCLMISGCSRGKELAPVKGEVLQFGIGLANAWVEFYPEFEEETGAFIGRTDEMGQFELLYTANAKGATVGKYTVRIGTGGLPDPNGSDTPTPRVLLYEQTGVEVHSGDNELLFEFREGLTPKKDHS